VIALAVNALVLWAIRVDSIVGQPAKRQEPRSVALAPLSRSEWEANRSIERPRSRTTVPVAPAAPPRKVEGQVVDVAPSKNATPPKDSRFVAEHNSTVEKETRSRHARPGYENTLPTPSDPRAGQQAAAGAGREAGAAAGGKSPGQPSRAGSLAPPSQASRDRLALRSDARGDVRPPDPRNGERGKPGPLALLSPPTGEAGQSADAGRDGLPGGAQLRPSAASYDRLAGGPAPDRLDGVEEGEGTYLNTREWKYASYFNRIKQAVATQWDPNGALIKRDPTGQRYAYKDRLTVLTVKLDGKGSLKDVHVQRSSGVDFLDITAVEAFRKAQPFVNPPGGLADEHGEIAFVFGFYLEVGAGLRIFRGPMPP
jgi:TonB family protein